ncbi:MAG: hypothetical protein OWU33_15205 [Firmicutes bacterium]|nr:hypothetical protein [Bacillota bacterium]
MNQYQSTWQPTAQSYTPVIRIVVVVGAGQVNRIANRHFSPFGQFILGVVEVVGSEFFIKSPRSEIRGIGHGFLAAGSVQCVKAGYAMRAEPASYCM